MRIFIADYLPLKNKGEEEILRGIETIYTLKTSQKINFYIFDDVKNVCEKENIIIFPSSSIYPDFSIRKKSRRIDVLKGVFKQLLFYCGYIPFESFINKNSELKQAFTDSDLILIGHDGFYNSYSAALSYYLHKRGIKYALLGSGFNRPNKKIKFIADMVNRKCFNNAAFVFLREKTAFDYVKEISNNPKVELYPDPAFFCSKRISELLNRLIVKYNLLNCSLKVALTVCENSISFSNAFININNKIDYHRNFIADIIDKIVEVFSCKVYFLPHCIEEGPGNDLAIAKDIQLKVRNKQSVIIIEEDIPVLELKSIISMMDFVIGERTHSIINSISEEIPFISLTSSKDFRTHDIIGYGCGLGEQIIDLDEPNLKEVQIKIVEDIQNRGVIKKNLRIITERHEKILNDIIEII